jgi:hypothetical protein
VAAVPIYNSRLDGLEGRVMDSSTHRPQDLDWGDCTLFGLLWENDGKDLRLLLSHASLPISGLVCSWASDLRVDLSWHRVAGSGSAAPMPRGGPLLSTEGRISRSPLGRWKVALAFGSDGTLELECDQVTVLGGSAR